MYLKDWYYGILMYRGDNYGHGDYYVYISNKTIAGNSSNDRERTVYIPKETLDSFQPNTTFTIVALAALNAGASGGATNSVGTANGVISPQGVYTLPIAAKTLTIKANTSNISLQRIQFRFDIGNRGIYTNFEIWVKCGEGHSTTITNIHCSVYESNETFTPLDYAMLKEKIRTEDHIYQLIDYHREGTIRSSTTLTSYAVPGAGQGHAQSGEFYQRASWHFAPGYFVYLLEYVVGEDTRWDIVSLPFSTEPTGD